MKLLLLLVTAILSLCNAPLPAAESAAPNILRNGSFEGALLYWHGTEASKHELVRGDAPLGDYKLRIKTGYVMSAPFVCQPGEEFTLSFLVRGDKPGTMHVQLPPSAREDGQRAKRLWTGKANLKAKVTTEWQRVSFTAKADVSQSGFWPKPHYMALIAADGSTPIEIDGVSVQIGRTSPPDFVPRGPLEVVVECPDLPGYVEHGNLFAKGAKIDMTAHVANATKEDRTATLRWQLYDYEGEQTVGPAIDNKITVPAGKTVSTTTPLELTATGCVLAKATVIDGDPNSGTAIDSSLLPLTSLPYPKAATKPDWRERFGGSFAGGKQCVRKFQQLGFGWIRWRPHMNWEDHQPEGPDSWKWFDEILDEQEALGCSTHCVMYGRPKWAFDGANPLPKDMQWPADDKRWEDLSIETNWDRFVKKAVEHYRGRSLVYEIENEPEFDKWDNVKPQYAKFTIRTARLIKQVDPKAKVMVDNVYGIPSAVNAEFLRQGGCKYIDIFSWHDYHAGWLADATAMRRMKQNLAEADGKHVEIWFNEGWAFTNTAVDEPIACTHLNAAQSTNAMMCSTAELTANGQEKTILFHVAYENHGMSFWDYSGPGTMLWDWYNLPLPTAAAFNTLGHHIGISDVVGFVRPVGANFCIFHDLRNDRGVMVAYADRDSKADVEVTLPIDGLIAEDIMGNAKPQSGNKLVLKKSGRPVVLYTAANTPGKEFLSKLEPLDRKNAGFVSSAGAAGETVYRLPMAWEGSENGSAKGNQQEAGGKPIWRLDRLYPVDPIIAANYAPMVWDKTRWTAPDHTHGGHPSASVADGVLNIASMGPWNGELNFQKIPVLVFVAPESGVYRLTATAHTKPWDGGAKSFKLAVMKKDAQRAAEIKSFELPRDATKVPVEVEAELTAGHELLVLPLMPHYNNATNTRLEDLKITRKAE